MNPLTTDTTICRPWDSPVPLKAELTGMTTGKVPYTQGLTPVERPSLPGYDSAVACLVMGLFLLIAFNFRHYSTYIKTFGQDLWSVRLRENVFNVKTMSETRVQTSLVILLCISEATIVYMATLAANHGIAWTGTFTAITLLGILAAAFYYLQAGAYRLLGYVFSTPVVTRQWAKGFSASQSLLGMVLVLPALIVLFNPTMVKAATIFALIAYLCARLIFIAKGFRLFYGKKTSWVVFILYLCSLEIVPLSIMVRVFDKLAAANPFI